jgi:predicted dehydrogenase
VTRLYYLPSFKRLEKIGAAQVVAFFDPDESAMQYACSEFKHAIAASDADDLLDMNAELAIVASPPRLHAQQAIKAMEAGLHVYCEKPMATTLGDADSMIAASLARERKLTISFVRRQLPATKTIRDFLAKRVIGELQSIECFEGGTFVWPANSSRYFDYAEFGGGVMQDIGSHCLDLLTWWLGSPIDIEYQDDSVGGVEANCQAELRYPHCTALVRLSRDWGRPNLYRLEGDCGSLTWEVNEPDKFDLVLAGNRMTVGLERQVKGDSWSGGLEDCFTWQLEDMIEAVRNRRSPYVPAIAGRNVVALVEQCYRQRHQTALPWFSPAEHQRVEHIIGASL